MIWWRRRSTYIFLIFLLIILALFPPFAPLRDGLRRVIGSPVRLLDRIAQKFVSAGNVIISARNLARDNSSLKQQNFELEAKLAQLQTIQSQNQQLRRDLNFKDEHKELRLLAANVIGYSPTGLHQAVTIDRGKRDGLRENQAAIGDGHLIGEVKNVSDSTAEVWLLNNPSLLTPVMLAGSQTIGILKGSIQGLIVENIPLDAKVKTGDNVVTSSLEGLYPSGIVIGKVEEIVSSKEEIFLTLRVSSPVNINSVSQLYIVE